jgi:hypothetical protein
MPLVGLFRAQEDKSPTPRLIVVGQPGTGKTTFLQRLAAAYATGEAEPLGVGSRVPILVPLAAWARAREEQRADLGFYEFLAGFLEERGVPGPQGVASLAPELLLLVDGLDEVRGVDQRRRIVEELRQLPVETGPALVLTVRSSVFDELTEAQRVGFRIVGCRHPSPAQMEQFLKSFFKERGLPFAEAQAKEVFRRIQGDPALVDLARTPLLLVFLALLHELEGRIPDRRSLLYRRIGEILLDRWERVRSRAAAHGPPAAVAPRAAALGDSRRVVGTFAWWMINSGRDEVTTEELQGELVRMEKERGTGPEDAETRASALVALVQSGSAVFVLSSRDHYRFVHTTLAEYFAGVEMARGGARWKQVMGGLFNPDWQEIVVFCAGELGQRGDERLEELGQALLRPPAKGGRYGASHAALIAAVLREDPGFSLPLLRKLVERFVGLCLNQRYWPRSQPLIAAIFRDLAKVATQRSWLQAMQAVLSGRDLGKHFWQEDHVHLAENMALIYRDLQMDAEVVLSTLVTHPSPMLRLAGWKSRLSLAAPEAREVVINAAMAALPECTRYDMTGNWVDLLGDDLLF